MLYRFKYEIEFWGEGILNEDAMKIGEIFDIFVWFLTESIGNCAGGKMGIIMVECGRSPFSTIPPRSQLYFLEA